MSGARPYSQDAIFEQVLAALYRHWYRLPRRSTLPALQALRMATADQLAGMPGPLDATRFEQVLIDFCRGALELPGTLAAAGEALRRLAGAEPFSVRGSNGGAILRTDGTPARRDALVAWLAAPEPAAAAIGAMHYDPLSAPRLWQEVWGALEAAWPRLPEGAQARALAIRAALDRHLAAPATPGQQYVAALKAVEQVPELLRVVCPLLAAGKSLEAVDSLRGGQPGPKPPPPRPTPPPPPPTGKEAAIVPAALPNSVAPATAAPAPVDFQVGVRFPVRVKRGETHPLRVQLLIDFPPETPPSSRLAVAFGPADDGRLPSPEVVEVRLSAADFDEETGCWDRAMLVYPDRNSQPAVFLLTPRLDRGGGRRRIVLDFLHRGRPLGSVHFMAEVVDTPTLRSGDLVMLEGELAGFETAAPAAADLEIRIVKGERPGQLSMLLNSARGDLPFHNMPVGDIDLAARDPQLFLAPYLERLSQLAADAPPGERDARVDREVARIGELLFELLPAPFQEAWWATIQPLQQAGRVRTLLVYSDEPWIPWEIIKPYRWDSASDTESTAGFFAENFVLSRWLAGRGPAARLAVHRAALVMPELNLDHVQAEQRFFADLARTHALAVDAPLQRRDEVLDNLQRGGFELLHVATHGNFNSGNVEQSELSLVGGSLRPADLGGSGLSGLRRARPLVFFNACYSGQIAYHLVGLGGWAQKFCAANVSAFVGTLWEVNDKLATAFAQAFYSGLAQGKTLGEAFFAAREEVRRLAPANPTWLAYTLYGDPNALVSIEERT